jgi:hypothetical protein
VFMDSAQAENYERLAEMLALKKLERKNEMQKSAPFLWFEQCRRGNEFLVFQFAIQGLGELLGLAKPDQDRRCRGCLRRSSLRDKSSWL